MSATPDVRFIMDNQFKNVKTHARLLSKAMWYEWRMKLLDGLREGLCKISAGLSGDEKFIAQQEGLLAPVLPLIVEEHQRLVCEHSELRTRADELASCDQGELRAARESLNRTDKEIEEKRQQLAEMENQAREREASIKQLREKKGLHQQEIKEAEKVREECRGWSFREVEDLKGRLHT